MDGNTGTCCDARMWNTSTPSIFSVDFLVGFSMRHFLFFVARKPSGILADVISIRTANSKTPIRQFLYFYSLFVVSWAQSFLLSYESFFQDVTSTPLRAKLQYCIIPVGTVPHYIVLCHERLGECEPAPPHAHSSTARHSTVLMVGVWATNQLYSTESPYHAFVGSKLRTQ